LCIYYLAWSRPIYAKSLLLPEIWMVVFVDTIDEVNRARLENHQLDADTGVVVHPVFVMIGQNTL